MRRGAAAIPLWLRSTSALALRATAIPIRFATEPPLTRIPLAVRVVPEHALAPVEHLDLDVGRDLARRRRRSSSWSRQSISASTPSGVPVPITQPQKRGWMLPSG